MRTVEPRNEEATSIEVFDHAIGLQPRHGLLDRLPGDIQMLGESTLAKMRTRREAPAANLVHKGRVKLIGKATGVLKQH